MLLTLQESAANECIGMDYLVKAAEKGVKSAMLEVAKALDTGMGLGKAPEDDPGFTAKQRYSLPSSSSAICVFVVVVLNNYWQIRPCLCYTWSGWQFTAANKKYLAL